MIKPCIERYDGVTGHWNVCMAFQGPDGMTKARENFEHILRNQTDVVVRLIVIHAEHDGTSDSAAKLLR